MVLLLVACFDDTPAPPPPDLLIGVWAAGDGARVELALRENRLGAGAVACEGRFAFDQWSPDFGSVGDWNYSSWDPLVLNLVDGAKRARSAVWDVDPSGDTARMRVVADASAAQDPRVFDGPGTRVLRRVPSSPRPDAGDCPKPRLQP